MRVAGVAAFSHIDVAALKLQRSVGLHAGNGGHVALHNEGGHHFNGASNKDNHQAEHEQLNGLALNPTVPVLVGMGLKHGCKCRGFGRFVGNEGTALGGFHQVHHHNDYPAEVHEAAKGTQGVHGDDLGNGFKEVGIGKEAVLREFLPHKALGEPSPVHGNGVENDAERAEPKVDVGEALRSELGAVEFGQEPVEHSEGEEAVPAKGANVNVGDDPIGKVGEGVDAFERHHRTFKRSHTVTGNGHYHELEYCAFANAVPGATQGEQAVDHTSPGGRNEHDGEHHAKALGPIGQGGIQQVVWTGPDVNEDEGPEVDDAQAVGVYRAVGGLGHKVVHEAQVGRSEEEGHRVVTVPPLHQRILHTCVPGVAFEEAHRKLEGVYDVQHGYGNEGGYVKPNGYVEVALPAL